MNTLVVIPARGGSKGIPHKNVYIINGKPLLAYTIECMLSAELPDTDIVVSTDDENIKAVAKQYDEITVIDRPEEISTDTASTESVLLHALDYMERTKTKQYDIVITAQPTSPLRKAKTVRLFWEKFACEKHFDAMLTLHENREDHWVVRAHRYERLFPSAPRRRQQREPLYIENSMLYATKADALRKTRSVLGAKVTAFIIDEVEGTDINEINDLKLAEYYLKQEHTDN